MKPYNPTAWYYSVGDSSPSTQVFSSASGSFVPLTDATYVAWGADGTQAMSIDTAAHLGSLLAQQQIRPTDATVLSGYQGAAANTIVGQALFKILFNHENRIRTIERQLNLNGSPPNLTVGQALAAVQALM